jgi:hypothetical protein
VIRSGWYGAAALVAVTDRARAGALLVGDADEPDRAINDTTTTATTRAAITVFARAVARPFLIS